ncbi:MAG TPA: type II toxin-antitoxin system VapC family toxin [Solirubrobacteraceae bacterium]|nr:type II toxin-antitoxin system VapC family toxin [Solirubrobacteraceae bacterium]
MNVVDAGVIVELVAGGLDPARLGVEDLAAPHLLDSQVMHVLRGLVLRGALTQEQAVVAMGGFAELAIARYPADWLRPRMWALRRNLSAYDATYVALAEMTAATSLLTTDARLAHAPGVRCTVQVL